MIVHLQSSHFILYRINHIVFSYLSELLSFIVFSLLLQLNSCHAIQTEKKSFIGIIATEKKIAVSIMYFQCMGIVIAGLSIEMASCTF